MIFAEIVQKNKMLVDLNSKITTNTKLLQEVQEKLNAKIELGEFLKQEKIKYHIMQKSFPLLREEFNKILKRMFYGEIRVFIDNKFDITVVRNGIEKNFENFSEGEKKRLDLGFIFTIHEFLSLIPFNMIHQFDISNLIIVHFFIPYINSQ